MLKKSRRPPEDVQKLIEKLQAMFKERPIWTRRGIINWLQTETYSIKYALPYVSYFWKQGPWRDAYVRLGYDPRADVEGAMYQSVYFTIAKSTETPEVDDS